MSAHSAHKATIAARRNIDFGVAPRMKIAVVQDFLRMGGTERQSVGLANAFRAAGHEVLLLTFRPGGPLLGQVRKDVLRVALQHNDLGLDWFTPGLTRVLRGFGAEIAQLMGRMANAHGAHLIGALPRSRIVATFRTGKSIPCFYRKTLRDAAAVVTNSDEATQRLAREHGITGPRVHVIRNAVAEPEPAPPSARAELRREIGTPPDAVVFLCVAMMRQGKGHRRLIELAAQLDLDVPWELWFAGDGSEFEPALALAKSAGLEHHVRFLGLRHDTRRLYRAADVAVLASSVESLPNFLIEAQWMGLPVVAFDTAGVRETFAPGASGFLLAHGDDVRFCAACERLATEAHLRATMSAAARAHAEREFDPARQNERYLKLYAELLNR